VVKDTEAKSRVIAMGDYWSQTALKPLHSVILQNLEVLKMDMTFDQSIAPFGPSNQNYYSFDLTAATDNIPLIIQEHL
jgi:hypothetical protein